MTGHTRHRAAFKGDASGVRAMRAWLSGYLEGHPRADDIALVSTELASNATRHTASAGFLFAAAIEHEPAGTRVTVQDLGSEETKPEVHPAGEDDAGRHGLALVEALSDAWGTEGDAFGRDTWAYWD